MHKIISNKQYIYTQNIDVRVDSLEFINGFRSNYASVNHPGSSMIIAIDNNNKIIMLSQYRFCISDYIYEFPSGTIKEGESPLEAAKRELVEETGFIAKKWQEIGCLYEAPSYSNELIYVFIARDISNKFNNLSNEKDEFIKISFYKKNELSCMINKNIIKDSATISSFYKYEKFH